jgi:excisionase family DNA binding protein
MASDELNGEAVSPPRKRSNPGQPALAGRSSLIDVEELAEWLGVEVVFVRRLVAERRIPFLKIGKFVRFDPSEMSVWIDHQRVSPSNHSSRTRITNRG